MSDIENQERSLKDTEAEEVPLLDPMGGPPNEGLVGIYEDPLVDLDFPEVEKN